MIGLYTPSQGSVRIDGVDIRQIDPGDLRRNVGSVLQDVWLFTGTLRENIAIGAVRPRDEAILDAARLSGVEEFVARHPRGYDLMLSERGEGLSGGQRQSIALARALVSRPPVLLFDEPTSAMDVQTEAGVIKRLKSGLTDRTMVIVTHRTALLALVDRVIVIEDGCVAFDGDKSQMLRAGQARGAVQ
jgi:ATP-binding cassette subfamily C protein LapB